MIDWFILLAPLLLLPIYLLFAFVGCTDGVNPRYHGVHLELRVPPAPEIDQPRALFRWTVDGRPRAIARRDLVSCYGTRCFTYTEPGEEGEWEVWCNLFDDSTGRRWQGPTCTAFVDPRDFTTFIFELGRNPTSGELEIVIRDCPA